MYLIASATRLFLAISALFFLTSFVTLRTEAKTEPFEALIESAQESDSSEQIFAKLKAIKKLDDGSFVLDFAYGEGEIIYQKSLVPFSYDKMKASLIIDLKDCLFPDGIFFTTHEGLQLRASSFGAVENHTVRVVLEGDLSKLESLEVMRSDNQLTLIPQTNNAFKRNQALLEEDDPATVDLSYEDLQGQLDRNYPQEQIWSLSLKEAVLETLSKNLDIKISQDKKKAKRLEAEYNWGVYAPTIGTENYYRDERQPVASAIAGGLRGIIATEEFVNSNFLRGKLPSGTSYEFSFDNQRSRTDNVFQQLVPQYQSSLNFSITQSLLRNAWIDQDRQTIQVAKVNAQIANFDLEDQMQNSVFKTEQAYWDLALAKLRVLIREQAVELALEQLKRIKRGSEIGNVAKVESISAETELERRKDDLLLSQQQLFSANTNLKLLLSDGKQAEIWRSKLLPSDQFLPQPMNYDLESILAEASKKRPTFRKLKSELKIKDIEWNYLFNQGFPQIDLVAEYSLYGLSGTDRDANNPFNPNNSNVPPVFTGGYFKNISNLFSNDFRAAQIGFRFSWPISPQSTKKVLNRVDLEKHQIKLQVNQQIQSVQVEILNAFQEVTIGKQRIEASKAALIDAEKQLQAEQDKFKIGLSTNFLVLTRQNDLSTSQERLASVIADYNKSLSKLKKAAGVNLDDYHIKF
ncbi:MAG: TolC family protein [Candidatus Caenarcaniphilales bacterium]|nr:TolC family protein [Candidatus Caenarcaniphilales bacterium]